MKRVLLSLIAFFSLLSCDSQENLAKEEPKQNSSQYTYTLKLALCMPEDSAEYLAAMHFSELVEKRTKGQMAIEIVQQGTKSAEREIISAVQKGNMDFAIIPTSRLSYIAPDLQLFDLPFFFEDVDAVNRVYDSSAGQILLSKLDIQGLVGLAFWHGGFKNLVTKEPLTNPEDMKSQRFKVFESSLLREQFSRWGAHSLSLAASQTPMAYDKKAIDGEENTLRNVLPRLPDDPHITLTNHGYLTHVMTMSLKSFESIPEKFQSVIENAAADATAFQHEVAAKKNQEALTTVTAKGMTSEASPVLLSWLQQHSAPLLEYYRMRLGTEMVEQILQAKEDWTAPHPDKLLVALDAT
ncbi:TRAP transporter substrate-binding protein [Enterovibrio coralii]|uniref:TRAP transporter substrate-binding protein n=1 Tax=Enterovibrio coralii TaxID=294935 RepID=UPI000A970D82|nr:TRAP transporter substrate-binding protein [Enterovibrio coralii]